ncbi:TPA: hypothetical protein N3J59_002259 [Klebsiella quasipneumoniae]|uniref:hypothetical protein n=1 Tax=Klebsiella quasipneumoniae TaxID=1463165 RepID=UPI00389066AD|nr:hypothetical protein [Klebsiella quasipneumoniae]
MTSKLTREKAQWLHDACEEAAAAGIKLTMNPNELLMFTSYALAAMDSEPVAQCPYPCGWDTLNKLAIQDAAFVALALVAGEPATESIRQAAITNSDRLLKVISACRAATLAAAPQEVNHG